MNIAVYGVPHFFPEPSGDTIRISELVERIGKKYNVDLYTLPYSGFKEEYINGVKIKRGLGFSFKKYDLIHANMVYGGIFALPSHTLRNIPIIYDPHDLFFAESVTHFPQKYIVKFWEHRILKYCDIILATGNIVKEEILKWGVSEEKIKTIRNGVDFDIFKPQPKSIEDNTITFVGGLNKIQGIDILIETIKNIKKEIPTIKVYMVGSGNINLYRKLANSLSVNKNITFIGAVPHKKIAEYINRAEVCIAPFRKSKYTKYAYPIKILEYLACGKPVVATDLSGIREIKDTTGGIVLSDRDTFAKDIISVLHNEKSLKINYERLKESYSWDKIAEKTIKIYKDMIHL